MFTYLKIDRINNDNTEKCIYFAFNYYQIPTKIMFFFLPMFCLIRSNTSYLADYISMNQGK